MIEKLIEYSIRNRFLVLIVASALAMFAVYAVLHTPMDAVPDLGENQVIVFTDWMGRSPREIEDQITYPLSLKLQGLVGVKTVRSSSEFNFSMITLIFEDNIDFYFARQRVLERLTLASTFLPEGVVPYLAADTTAVGQIFWYTIDGGKLEPGPRWALQKYYVGPEINSVPGVAEVGAVGGTPLEYQIDVDPNALRAYNITLGELYDAVARSNSAVGGRVMQKNNAEYLIRGVGWIENTRDIENTVITERDGTPIYVKNVASVQMGTQFRRSVFIKAGNETVGGAVMMRHGENPLAVTNRVKRKIQELQSALPPGVHIVPAYDRTRLIHGAIHNVTQVMWHEMLIAGVAILLILMHFRSVFVICVTLPLAVLFSFLMMWVLRVLHILDVQANIMSLAGITISIGILVDQAIVMVENATHHLKEHFGDKPVRGNTTEIVVRACRTVGRPIFFSVLIILISFVPVFAMSGREGKYFHPMAFTKSLAMVGVALISVTVVPALIPTFIKGRIRGEEENPIVRSFIYIYKPLLTWALPRRNLVMWMFAALLILAAGMFPLQAVLGEGAGHREWAFCFLATVALVIFLTVAFIKGPQWQLLSFATLVGIALLAYHFPKIGVEFMPALNEQSALYMPVTVPRVSVTQAADDLKIQDALFRQFPEVESAVNKAGRADTPTDPAPLEMAETFVNFRPKELWPRRAMAFDDASRQIRLMLAVLEQRGYVQESAADERDALINDAAMGGLTKFDEVMRDLALRRYREFERELMPVLTRFVVEDTVRRFRKANLVRWPDDVSAEEEIDQLVDELTPRYGAWLSRTPALEDVTKITQAVARRLSECEALTVEPANALELREAPPLHVLDAIAETLGSERKTFAGEVLKAMEKHRRELWIDRIHKRINWELFDRGVEAFVWSALEEIGNSAKQRDLLRSAPHGEEFAHFVEESTHARNGKEHDQNALKPFVDLREEMEQPFAKGLILWQRKGGPKGDLLQELDQVVQMPGWSNIWTQPIQNRVDMLSTGVRTQVGVKVFGPDVETINDVCKQIEQALKPIPGAMDVIAEPFMGKGYLEIKIDREKAARYGVRVGDIQDTIEVALGGKVITQTVEGRDRFPVRVRYARDFREDEQAVKRLLVSRGNMGASGGLARRSATDDRSMSRVSGSGPSHEAAPWHTADGNAPLQIPLADLAEVRIVEGPATIKSENGRLRNYVMLNVRGDRDIVGFVEEAQRVVAEKVQLPEGVHLEWSGEFEHQVRAAKTLRIILPMVLVLIFVILYLTYKDLMDALLMVLAVPEALAGGVFFQFLFPKLRHGWSSPPEPFTLAMWVGYIAAFGMATETGIIMLVYLRESIDKRGGLENIQSLEELRQAVIEGAVHRLRPKLLTEGVAIVAIAPMLFSTGVGGEIISAMALPVLGGLLIADEVVDVFLPVRFYWVRRARWLKIQEARLGSSPHLAPMPIPVG
ncbi:MAG TPA: efflux RND transporter permease subunit [Gemmataceae bacterium]|jgi:Cu(I)/Ag(I) efflux system membrane protein CusA/SilA